MGEYGLAYVQLFSPLSVEKYVFDFKHSFLPTFARHIIGNHVHCTPKVVTACEYYLCLLVVCLEQCYNLVLVMVERHDEVKVNAASPIHLTSYQTYCSKIPAETSPSLFGRIAHRSVCPWTAKLTLNKVFCHKWEST